jgi:hypothetical protein
MLSSFVSSSVPSFGTVGGENGLAAGVGKISGVQFARSREEHGRGANSLLPPFAKFFSNDHEKT